MKDWGLVLNDSDIPAILKALTPKTKEEAHAFLMRIPYYRKQQRLIREVLLSEALVLYVDCLQSKAELIKESDGQFTGGFYTETYLYNDKEYEFDFDRGKLFGLSIYRREDE